MAGEWREIFRENRELWPTSVAGLAGHPPVNQGVPSLIPGGGMCLGWLLVPSPGTQMEGSRYFSLILMFFAFSFSLPPLPKIKKLNKIFFKKKRERCIGCEAEVGRE